MGLREECKQGAGVVVIVKINLHCTYYLLQNHTKRCKTIVSFDCQGMIYKNLER